ncbi:MAG: hypothetical protein JWN02_798 [Acidobacteria bacterium]|nr:hypothetical protein [Acidobacteriota bacterium]
MPSSAEILMAAARGEHVRHDVESSLSSAAAEGMLGLLARAAERVPRTLRLQAMAMEARSAGMVTELARIARAFEDAGIPLLAYKGAILAQQLYGAAGARAFSDLDVIVDPASADAGERVLRDLGYRECQPLSERQRKTNRRFVGETLFLDDASGVLADFHWLFSHVQFPLRIPFAEAWERRQSVLVDGHLFQTLGNTDLVVLTCSHAAKHLWHRLELLAQIGALARREEDWNAVDELAVAAGVARQTGLSFLLVRDLLEIAPPPLPQCLAAAGPVLGPVREIVARNLFAETRRMDAAGGDHFLLADRRRDAFRSLVLGALVPTHADWQGSHLPDALQWVVRPFRLLRKRLLPL